VGQRIDRVGVRTAMSWIAIAFGIALVGMSMVAGFITLAIGFAMIRLFGQGSLTLVSTVSVTLWFDKIRGTALGIYTTSLAILMSLVPVGLSFVMDWVDWRWTWIVAALVVVGIVVPIARYGMIDRPADIGQFPDGGAEPPPEETHQVAARSATRSEAIRSLPFWILAGSTASVGMLSTALNFHQISLLGDAGLTPTEAAVMFLPQVIGAATAGLLFGYLADRLTGRILIPMAMGLLATSLLLASAVTPGVVIVIYAICLGAAGGAARSVGTTLLPRWFGVGHIGAIQGTATFIGVASTALGPLAFSLARDVTGDFSGAARWYTILPIAAGVAALWLDPAKRPASADPS
jgi:MFS family permease